MTLDEHLLIFMLEKHRTRDQTEIALLDFLSSLKYYCESWQRAKTYGQLIGFLQADESFASIRKSVTSDRKLPQRLNDGKLNETDEPYVDIYVAEYFLHCYSLLTKEKKGFVESKEGYTYTTLQIEEAVSIKVLNFIPASETPKWNAKLRRTYKKLKTD